MSYQRIVQGAEVGREQLPSPTRSPAPEVGIDDEERNQLVVFVGGFDPRGVVTQPQIASKPNKSGHAFVFAASPVSGCNPASSGASPTER